MYAIKIVKDGSHGFNDKTIELYNNDFASVKYEVFEFLENRLVNTGNPDSFEFTEEQQKELDFYLNHEKDLLQEYTELKNDIIYTFINHKVDNLKLNEPFYYYDSKKYILVQE